MWSASGESGPLCLSTSSDSRMMQEEGGRTMEIMGKFNGAKMNCAEY
jgi:hypothetical protein